MTVGLCVTFCGIFKFKNFAKIDELCFGKNNKASNLKIYEICFNAIDTTIHNVYNRNWAAKKLYLITEFGLFHCNNNQRDQQAFRLLPNNKKENELNEKL